MSLVLGSAPKVHCSKVYRTNQQKKKLYRSMINFLAALLSSPSHFLSVFWAGPYCVFLLYLQFSPQCTSVTDLPFPSSVELAATQVFADQGLPASTIDKSVANGCWREFAAWKGWGEWGLGKGEWCPGFGVATHRDLLRSSSQRNCNYHLPSS